MFLNDMDFGFEEKRNTMLKPTINCIAPLVIAAGISAAAGIAGSLMGGDGPEMMKPEVLPATVSGNVTQEMNFMFDLEAGEAMDALVTQMNDWSTTDRDFVEKTFRPFQVNLIEANKALIPGIVANAGEAMKSSLKDLMGGDFLKDAFRNQMEKSGGDISKFAESFSQQIDDIPSAEQRIGETVSNIEQTFGQAGAELKRQMASRGLDVTQASQRDLAIEKAKAKAAGVGVAAEASRKEQLAGAQAGVGVAANVQTGQANLLATQQQLTQSGANLAPQIGGVQATEALSEAGKVGAGLTQAGAEQVLGTTSETKQAEFTQPGIVTPRFFDKETGKMVDAAGNEIKAPVVATNTRQSSFENNLRNKRKRLMSGGGPGVGGADNGLGGGNDTGGMGGGNSMGGGGDIGSDG
jgi:hypothetical protein